MKCKFFLLCFFSSCLLLLVSCKAPKTTISRPPVAERIALDKGQYSSKNGYRMFPNGTYRVLNIFVNIIYDITPERDPLKDQFTGTWPSVSQNGINQAVPTYLTDFMDVEFNSKRPLRGTMSRLYFESSFGNLLILGDFIVVNIPQSEITNGNSGQDFDHRKLVNKVVAKINRVGFNTLYGHNDMKDYDQDQDGEIDFTQILVRNPVNKRKPYNYGSKDIGDGVTGMSLPEEIEFKDGRLGIGLYSYQGIGMQNISLDPTNIVIHELSHNLLGDNGFHTSGGNHFGTPNQYTSTFMGLQRGYGLMGGGSLVSCNGYERWRLGWTNHLYNPNKLPIAAMNSAYETVSGEVEQDKKKQTIYLRDFVTYGDAVRIKLPYKDRENSSTQYLWLENHQVGRNGKLDWLAYSNEIPDCRPKGKPGVYAYVQVGKDILTGDRNQVYPYNETDNLRIVSAEGNWDIKYDGKRWDCPKWGERAVAKYIKENPLSGANDQYQLFRTEETDVLNASKHGYMASIKMKNNIVYSVGSDIGDEFDPFVSGMQMSLSTNPTPSNVRTYYVQQSGGKVTSAYPERNTNHVYLTGLNIKFDEISDKTFGKMMKVDITWDNYKVEDDVRWTGNIVVPEELILDDNMDIVLDQNYTAQREERDVYSGEFDTHTSLLIDKKARFVLENNAEVHLQNKSAMVIESGASLVLGPGAKIIVDEMSALQFKAGAKILLEKGAQLIVKEGGYFSASPDVIINCEDCVSGLSITRGAILAIPKGSNLERIESVKNIWDMF